MNALPKCHVNEVTSTHPSRRRDREPRSRRAQFVPKVLPPWSEQSKAPGSGHKAANRSKLDGAITLYVQTVGRLRPLSARQEAALATRAKRGNLQARDRLIRGVLPRVVEICRDYDNIALPLLDLVSEGNAGLLKAIDRFEPGQAASFTSHRTWWIRQSIKRALAGLANHNRRQTR